MNHITDTTLPLKVGQLNRGHGHYTYAVLDDTDNPIAEGFASPDVPIQIVRAVNNHPIYRDNGNRGIFAGFVAACRDGLGAGQTPLGGKLVAAFSGRNSWRVPWTMPRYPSWCPRR